MTPRQRRTLLGVLGFLTFAAVYSFVVTVPVLTQIAAEFGTTAGTAGLVAAAYGLPGIVIAVLVGPYSDRLGRKRFLVVGAATMGLGTVLSGVAGTFELLVATRVLAGVGASVVFPNVNAMIGDTFPYRERGRAISTVIAFNTMASIVGVPIAGIVAEATSWRVSVGGVGVVAVIAAAALAALLPSDHKRPAESDRGARAQYARILASRSAVATIVSSLLGALFWFSWVTFLVLYFQRTFDLSLGVASTVGLTMGLGVLIGSQVGGRLGDRVGHKPVVAGSIVISGALLFLLTNAPLGLVSAAALNLVLSAVTGARFATNSALLTEQVPEARGTMLALTSSVVSVGIVAGAVLGGVLVDGIGFWALGAFCAVVAAASAIIVVRFVTEEPIDLEIA